MRVVKLTAGVRARDEGPASVDQARRATNDPAFVRHLPGWFPRRSSLTGAGRLRHDRRMSSAAYEPDHAADDLGAARRPPHPRRRRRRPDA